MTTEDTQPIVLIVDDNPANIQVLASKLKSIYQIKIATRGEKAIEVARASPRPDIILLDIMMPGMDGYDVCKKLKSKSETADIPVIFVSAMDQVKDETLGFDIGAVDYIIKPFNLAIVSARIMNHLEFAHQRKELVKKNQQIKKMVQACKDELDDVNNKYQGMKNQQMDLLESLASNVPVDEELLATTDGDELEKLIAHLTTIVESHINNSMDIFANEHITDQQLLVTIQKLNSILVNQQEEDNKLIPQQLNSTTDKQDQVDDLLASLGL